MSDNVKIKQLATGVPGLDAVLGGGLPEYSFNLIAGSPGSGKTTLAHQIMFALATPQRRAIYFTVLGEPPLKMLRHQQQFPHFDAAQIGHCVHFVSLSDEIAEGDLDQVLHRIVCELEAQSPGLIFVDSFRAVLLAAQSVERGGSGPSTHLAHFVQKLGMLLSTWQATTFLIGEYGDVCDDNPVYTVVDGLIWLTQSVQRNSMVRKMQIIKMRGQASLPGLHTFRIGDSGACVFPPARVAPLQEGEANTVPEGSRLAMGVPGLDEMLGGGLPRGHSLLVAGPSGSGKSILATGFLAEGVRNGETGVIACFEQRPSQSRNRTLAHLIDSGKVSLVDSRAPDLSIDEILMLLITEIQRINATRVVIDSLSGFELAIAPTFREDFRESMARMVTALSALGVTVLMTSELEDRYTDLRFSPYGTAFLTDAIIVQRYVEVDCRLLRVLAVVKVRASAHSDALHQFSINEEGIHIGEPLLNQEGILGGRPTHKPLAAPPAPATGGTHGAP